jgi:hypothetical protein
MIARLAVAAALLGSAAGATAVLAADQDPPPRPTPPTIAVAAATPAATAEPVPVRNLRQEQAIADPQGGAPWAVRHFDTTFKLRRGTEPSECWELGRVQDGKFGWIDGHGTFTVRKPGRSQLPVTCRQLGRVRPVPARFARLTYPRGGQPELAHVITWGVAPDHAVRLEIAGEAPIALTPDQLYLDITGPRRFGALAGAFVTAGGRRSRFGDQAPLHQPKAGRPEPGPGRIAVRAPDPAGGQAWGVLVQPGKRGGLCFGYPERLVGDQAGWIDHSLDLFTVFMGPEMTCARKAPTRAFPLILDTMISGVENNHDRGEVERRVLSSRIIFWGRAHPDVVSVTFTTPRDVRTLIPSSEGHFVLAVYDGQFPGGKATATARMRNGKEVTRALYVE